MEWKDRIRFRACLEQWCFRYFLMRKGYIKFSVRINIHLNELKISSFVKILLQATCYTLAAMSIDRYLYVISPHPRPRWRTPFNACIICILIWIGKRIEKKTVKCPLLWLFLVSVAVIFPYTSLSSTSNADADLANACSAASHHPLFQACYFQFCAYYLLPLLIIALCYTRLFFHMRRSSKTITRHRVNFWQQKETDFEIYLFAFWNRSVY